MKKIVSLLLAMVLVLSSVIVYAEDNTGSVEYTSLKISERDLERANVSYQVGNGEVILITSTSGEKDPGNNITIANVPVGQTKVIASPKEGNPGIVSISVERDNLGQMETVNPVSQSVDGGVATVEFTTTTNTHKLVINFNNTAPGGGQPGGEGQPGGGFNYNTEVTVNITSNVEPFRVVLTQENHFDGHKIEMFETGTEKKNFDSTKQMRFKVEEEFGTSTVFESVKVNGTEMINEGPTNSLEFTLDFSETYNIEVKAVQEQLYSIMWANPGAEFFGEDDDFDSPEVKLEHGWADIKVIFDKDGENITESCYGGLDRGRGFANVPAEAEIIFEFVPERGYQLTSVEANGSALEAQENVNEYRYIMPDTPIHFTAKFNETKDTVVKTYEHDVTATVPANAVEAGTTQLNVDDASLSAESREEFETVSSEGGYEFQNALDIKLNQIFYKANTENEAWSYELNDLEESVKISVQLDESIQAEEYVIIHEEHDEDGNITGYKTLDTVYNPENHSVTFETSSFSNFAIATKGEIKDTSTNEVETTVKVDKETVLKNAILSDEQKAAVAEGTVEAKIKVAAKTKDAFDATTISSIEKELAKISANAKIGGYYDITLNIIIKDKNGNQVGDEVTVSEPGKVLAIIDCPTELINANTSVERKYYVIREHEGKYTIIPAKLVDGKIEFETDQFSTYVLVYEDVPTVVENNATKVESSSTKTETSANETVTNVKSPKTGDNAPLMLYVAIIAVSLSVIVMTLRKRKYN